ncbi:MAG: FliA/WhiG family RNA polymerase sigma factor [Firmicutes bacterium]|nr:FliA/WhiG family RNA polymerase sigma factor [Bacillota bacterium]
MPEIRGQRSYFNITDPGDKEALVLEYLPVIKKIAGKLSIALPAALDQSDLVGSGIIGLLEACERFDPSRRVPFSSYVSVRIRGAMIDEIRKVSLAPRSLFPRLRQIQETADSLGSSLGREPDSSEIAAVLGWHHKEIDKVWSYYNLLTVLSLEKLLFDQGGGEGITLEDLLASPGETPESALIKKEKESALEAALEELSYREKLLLSLYYFEDLTQKEIAGIMKISIARVSQLHARAIQRLQGILAEGN